MEKFKKAEKLKEGCFCNFFVDYDEVYKNYIMAGNVFKSEKNWQMCGESYMCAGDISIKLGDFILAIKVYSESVYAYSAIDNFVIAKYLSDIIVKLSIQNDKIDGDFVNFLQNFADILYNKNMLDDSLLYYDMAIKYSEINNKKKPIMKCLRKKIAIYEFKKDYQIILQLYDKIIEEYYDDVYKNDMMELICGSIIFRSIFITKDQKMEKCREYDDYLEKCARKSNLFFISKEYIICNKLLEAIEENDLDLLEIAILNIKSSKYMSNISDDILQQIKKNFEETEDIK